MRSRNFSRLEGSDLKTVPYKTYLGLKRHWFIVLTCLVYVIMSAVYMGPGFTKCTDSIYGFGDSTAGPIWMESVNPKLPLLGGYETSTNYPSGESLYSPVRYAAVLQSVALSTGSRIVGPVCAYNLFNIMGYVTTAIMMFAFIFYLTKSRWIALLAGYAVAYTPYVQSKIGGHPSYAFAGLLVAMIWLAIHIITRRATMKHAVMLAVLLAVCAYFDPYFILFAVTICVPVVAVWALTIIREITAHRINKSNVYETIKLPLVALGLFILLLSPLVYIRVHDAAAINADTGAARGNILASAQLCSNTPIDYLLPDPRNINLVNALGPGYITRNISHRHWCGFGESRVAISLTMISVIALGGLVLIWEKINGRQLRLTKSLSYNPRIAISVVSLIAVSALLIGLPPIFEGHAMPSYWIIKVTQTWRIFTREYLVLNVAVVILFAVILKYFSSIPVARKHRYILAAIFVLLGFGIASEYQINTLFNPPVFSYSRDIPTVYYQIKNNPDIHAIAEYPLDRLGIEHDSVIYYQTMQAVHKKSLFNSAVASDPNEKIHIAMKDLSDPQTIPALRAYGIRYVVLHGLTPEQISEKFNGRLQIIGRSVPPMYALTMVTSGGSNDVILAKILDGPKASSVLTIDKGFVVNFDIMKSEIDLEFEILQNTALKVTSIDAKKDDTTQNVCFEAKMSAEGDAGDLTVSVNGVPQTTVPITDAFTAVNVAAKESDTVLLHNSKGYNMRLNNLGCRAE